MKQAHTSAYTSMTDIKSASNHMLKVWRSLLTGKGVKKHRLSLVSGAKTVQDVVVSSPGLLRHLIISSRGNPQLPEIYPSAPVYRLRHELFREIDVFGTNTPVLVVEVPEFRLFSELHGDVSVILMVPFQDPANVGAVVRSAAAFGVRDIVILAEAANPYHPKSIRASGGQVFRVSCYLGPSIQNIDSIEMPIVALAADGMPVTQYTFPEKFALLPGVEGPGLPENMTAAIKISIPMEMDIESLNANVAASIALYEWKRRSLVSM